MDGKSLQHVALTKVCSVLVNIRDVSWHICQRMGVSLRKGVHFPFQDKNGAHKNKAYVVVAVAARSSSGSLIGDTH